MERMYRSDIIIEGNNLTAAALTYFLSLNKEADSITLIKQNKGKLNLSNLIPGVILPIFDFSTELMDKVFNRTIAELKDIHSLTSNFEFSNNPLAILYKGKEAINEMTNHRLKLESSRMNYRHLSLDDITNYYPFVNTQEEIHFTEIYNSYTCSNINDLVFTFQKLAKENGAEIIEESDELEFDKEKGELLSDYRNYDSQKMTILTSCDLIPNIDREEKSILRVVTPVLEKFPRISLFNLNTATLMWLEESGHFHIHRMFDSKNESENLNSIKIDFQKTFSHLSSLQILDSVVANIGVNNTLKSSIGRIDDLGTFYFSLPPQYEISLAPAIASCFSKLIAKNKLVQIKITLEELLKEI